MKKTLPTLFERFKAGNPEKPGVARGSVFAESDRIACHFFFLLAAHCCHLDRTVYNDMEGMDSVQH